MLTIRAGGRALDEIRANGLDPAAIDIVPGAAGGPKALGLSGLDRAVFGEWLPRARRTRHLVGASIGAWRFAAACCSDAVERLRLFAELYTEQRYPPGANAAFVSRSARAMLTELFAGREDEILGCNDYRLHILAVRGRWPLTRESRFTTPLGFGIAAFANALGRRHLARFIDRTVFTDSREALPFLGNVFDAFRTHSVHLDRENLGEALVASASIPLVLEGVPDIPRAPAGVYWDGGIIDYHLHLPYHRTKGLVLYPHFVDRIVPGWLDKPMPWRRARGEWLENVILVAPSRDYLAKLPHGKLPDRSDFKRFGDAERVKHWRAAIAESERLGEEFLRFVERPDPAMILPL